MNDAENKNGILVHNGKKYAVGLLWFANSGFSDRKIMQKRIQISKGDFYVKRENVARQLGIGWLGKKHKNAMPAAAPMAADKLVGEWHGVFEADNGWWYVEVHSDNLAPRGDIFFFDEDEAKAHFQEKQASHTWPRVYLPKSWEFEGENVSVSNLADILDADNKDYLLQPADIKAFAGSTLNLIVLVILLIGLAGGGYAAYMYLPDLLSPAPPPKRVIKPLPPVEEPEPIIEEEPEPAQEKVVERKVSPWTFTYACGSKMSEIFVPIPGWPISKATCNHSTVSVTWLKQKGTLDAAREQGQKMPRDVKVTIDGNTMTAVTKIGTLNDRPVREWLKKEQAVFQMEKSLKTFGKIEINFQTARAPVQKLNKGMKVETSSATAPSRDKVLFTLSSNTSPNIIGTYMDLPALQLDKIEWSVNGNLWVYEGHIDLQILTDTN